MRTASRLEPSTTLCCTHPACWSPTFPRLECRGSAETHGGAHFPAFSVGRVVRSSYPSPASNMRPARGNHPRSSPSTAGSRGPMCVDFFPFRLTNLYIDRATSLAPFGPLITFLLRQRSADGLINRESQPLARTWRTDDHHSECRRHSRVWSPQPAAPGRPVDGDRSLGTALSRRPGGAPARLAACPRAERPS